MRHRMRWKFLCVQRGSSCSTLVCKVREKTNNLHGANMASKLGKVNFRCKCFAILPWSVEVFAPQQSKITEFSNCKKSKIRTIFEVCHQYAYRYEIWVCELIYVLYSVNLSNSILRKWKTVWNSVARVCRLFVLASISRTHVCTMYITYL